MTLQAAHTQSPRTFGAGWNKKDPVYPIRVPRDAVESFRKTEPLFTEFLIETGRLIISEKLEAAR
jgi:hypothetical protein